jgi:hypothetical protein
MRWTTGFNRRNKAGIFFTATASSPAVEPTQSPIKRIPRDEITGSYGEDEDDLSSGILRHVAW